MNAHGAFISERQLALHKKTESFSVWVYLPFLLALGLGLVSSASPWVRALAIFLAMGIALVDGGLLAQWKAKAEGREGPFGR